jgi:hypothetical protein
MLQRRAGRPSLWRASCRRQKNGGNPTFFLYFFRSVKNREGDIEIYIYATDLKKIEMNYTVRMHNPTPDKDEVLVHFHVSCADRWPPGA